MATLDNYKGSLKVSAGLTPMGDFPVAEAHDILVDAQGTRLDTKLTELANGIGTGGGSGSSSGSGSGSTGDFATTGYVDEKITALIGGAGENLDTLKELADNRVPRIGNSVTSHKVYLAAASSVMGVTHVGITSKNLRYAPGNNTDATADGEVPLRRASDQTMQCKTPVGATVDMVANVGYVRDQINEVESIVANNYLKKNAAVSADNGGYIELGNGIYYVIWGYGGILCTVTLTVTSASDISYSTMTSGEVENFVNGIRGGGIDDRKNGLNGVCFYVMYEKSNKKMSMIARQAKIMNTKGDDIDLTSDFYTLFFESKSGLPSTAKILKISDVDLA